VRGGSMNKAEEWATAQRLELEHWRASRQGFGRVDNNLTPAQRDQGYRETSRLILTRFGFDPEAMAGTTIADIGAGPTGRLTSISRAWKVAIDPLWPEYRDIEWAQTQDYATAYAWSAEIQARPLVDRMDYVFCINCLDHCQDPAAVMRNAASYLVPGRGRLFVSVDILGPGEEPDEMHPSGALGVDDLVNWVCASGLVLEKIEKGGAFPLGNGKWLDAWGGGTAYHVWAGRPRRG